MKRVTARLARPAVPLAIALLAFLSVGLLGTRSYLDNFLRFRGFAPPREPAYVSLPGTTERLAVPSPALGGRRPKWRRGTRPP